MGFTLGFTPAETIGFLRLPQGRKLLFRSGAAAPRASIISAMRIVFAVLLASLIASSLSADVPAPKNLAELRKIEEKIQQASQRAIAATVAVRVGKGAGSGVIVSEDGYVLTAGHVAGRAGRKAKITLADGRTVNAVTLGVYASADAGMLKISDSGPWPFVEQGEREQIEPGMWCMVLGHPLGKKKGRPPVLRIGRVLKIQANTLQTDCPLIGGDSGGPLVALDGKLIGINSRISVDIARNFHVPISVFRDNWQRLVAGEVWEDQLPSRDAAAVKKTLGPAAAEAAQCVVQVKCDGKKTILGTIVGPDGWILTKASELRGRIVCRLPDGRDLEARIVGIDSRFDLAMLKIEATDLAVIPWSGKQQTVGRLVAAVGMDERPLAFGVVSTPRRAIPPPRAAIGVVIVEGKKGLEVTAVLPKGPAQKAGMKRGDQITNVDGKSVKTRKQLSELLENLRPGTKVRITLARGEKNIEVEARLARLMTLSTKKQDMLNRTGVGVSRRADDFPVVLQHDAVLRPSDCGSPLVNLDGKVVGVNIARGGRAETYCVPTDVLLPLMYTLMSGRARPKKAADSSGPETTDAAADMPVEQEEPDPQEKTEPERQKSMPKEQESKPKEFGPDQPGPEKPQLEQPKKMPAEDSDSGDLPTKQSESDEPEPAGG